MRERIVWTVMAKGILKGNMFRWLSAVLLLCLAMAGTVPGAQQKGSVTVQLPQSAAGVELSLYAVADFDQGNFTFRKTFAAAGIVIDNLNDASQAEAASRSLAQYAVSSAAEPTAVKTADDTGKLSFFGLDPALYLIAQTDGTDILAVQPALAPVPYSSQESSGWIYDAVLELKYSFPGGAVIVTKVDENGKPLGLAQFVLQRKIYLSQDESAPGGAQTGLDQGGAFYWKEFKANLASSALGQVVITDMPLGDYRFIETAAPDGYIRTEEPAYFSITRAGLVQVESSGKYRVSGGQVELVTVVNDSTTVTVDKVDEKGEKLAGARLVVKDSQGKVIRGEDGEAAFTVTTTGQQEVLRALPAGNYYLCEVETPEGYQLAEDVAFTVSAARDADNTVTMVDQKTPEKKVNGSLTVTKELKDINGLPVFAEDAVFYVALFQDEQKTKRISSVKPVSIRNGIRGTAVFEDLDINKTYYLGETDAYGELISSVYEGGQVYVPAYPKGYEIKLTRKAPDGTIAFENTFYELPAGYYYGGELTVTKKTLKGGKPYKSSDTFYAALFTDKGYTERLGDVIALSMEGGSEASQTIGVSIGEDPKGRVAYYITETDKEGNPLENGADLKFEVSVDTTKVTLSPSDAYKKVTITNTFPEKKEREDGSEEESEPKKTPGGHPDGGGNPPSVRTGDDTPLLELFLLMAAAAVAAGYAGRRLRRRRQ